MLTCAWQRIRKVYPRNHRVDNKVVVAPCPPRGVDSPHPTGLTEMAKTTADINSK